ncbi:lipopolysaccharide biosynthesis protein [Bacteroides fragilis]|nr:lipopolysaccharide biosynthesis protein [Bacteroides fragilis]
MHNYINNQAVKSVIWSAMERISVQAIQFILTIILARLIAPAEFGLIAMLGIFMQVAQSFVDSGFSNALIQKKDRSEIDFSTVFYFNCVISIAVYIALYISTPYIAQFYNEPILANVCKWIGLNLILQGIAVVQVAKLTIDLDFKTQAKASLVAVTISGALGLFFAYNGYGVWALVIQSLFNSLINTLLLFFYTKWKPTLEFSWLSLKSMFAFGSKLLLSGLLHTIYINLYSLVIGKKYNAVDVGYYNQSNQIARFPSVSLMAIITRALYPIQCKNQDNYQLLQQSFVKYLKMSCFLVFTVMAGIASLSEPLVMFLLTEKWISIAPILSILCIGYMFTSVTVLNNQILNVRGRSDLYLKVEIIKKVVGIIILVTTIPFGLVTICLGILFYNICDMLLVIYYSKKSYM